jgi:hypothetical protein
MEKTIDVHKETNLTFGTDLIIDMNRTEMS